MTGDDRVRRCQRCNLHVYNFTEMTRSEIEDLVDKREGRLCVRLYHRADGTVITKDCPIGFGMKVRRISRIAGAALAGAMTIPAMAQTAASPKPRSAQLAPHMANLAVEVRDPAGMAVPNAMVSLIDSAKNTRAEQKTNAEGWAKILNVTPGEYHVQVSSPGFMTATERVALSAGEHVGVETKLLSMVTGEFFEVDVLAHKTGIPKSYFESNEASPPEGGLHKVLRKLHL